MPIEETSARSLGQEDLLEKRMATHSSILAWRIPWTEEPAGLQSTGSQKAGHSLATKQQQQGCCRGRERIVERNNELWVFQSYLNLSRWCFIIFILLLEKKIRILLLRKQHKFKSSIFLQVILVFKCCDIEGILCQETTLKTSVIIYSQTFRFLIGNKTFRKMLRLKRSI